MEFDFDFDSFMREFPQVKSLCWEFDKHYTDKPMESYYSFHNGDGTYYALFRDGAYIRSWLA